VVTSEHTVFYFRLYPGREAEYDRRHRAVWPEQLAALSAAGLGNMTGFRRGTDVWYYARAVPDRATAYGRLSGSEVDRRWGEYFKDTIAEITGPDGELLWYTCASASASAVASTVGERPPPQRILFGSVMSPAAAILGDLEDLADARSLPGVDSWVVLRRGRHAIHVVEAVPDADATRIGAAIRAVLTARGVPPVGAVVRLGSVVFHLD
jgi:L-rhamnose mutarotase